MKNNICNASLLDIVGRSWHSKQKHEQLPDDLVKRLQAVWRVIGTWSCSRTFERFEHEFTHDTNPEREVQVVEWVALAFASWCADNPTATYDQTTDALSSLYVTSTGAAHVSEEFTKRYSDAGGQITPITYTTM